MKIVTCVVVFAVLWDWSSSSGPVPCSAPSCMPAHDDPDNSEHLHRSPRGFVTTVNKTARYVGKKLHIIRKRSASEGSLADSDRNDSKNDLRQIRKADSVADVPMCVTNSSAPKESRSKRSNEHTRDNNQPAENFFESSNTQNETGAELHSGHGNRTKRTDDSGDPRYILVHDVPPCKKRRSIGDYDQPAPVCNTQGGKNITIIIQNSMDQPSEQPRHARSVEEDGRNGSEEDQVLDKREAADDISTGDNSETKAPGSSTEAGNVSKRAVVDDQTSVPSAAVENHPTNIMKIHKADADKNEGTGDNVAIGRKLLWNQLKLDNGLYLSNSDDDDQADPFISDNFLNPAARETVIHPINYEQDFTTVPKQQSEEQDEAKIVAEFQSDAFLNKLEDINQVTSVARCICAVFSDLHSNLPVIAGRFRDRAEARGCARACFELAERYYHLRRTVPIQNTNDSDGAEERARQLEQAHHLEVAWLIILVLNIVVGINTLVIGYMCSSTVEKKKRGVFLLHDYSNIPHGID